jgi:hypothetical protein
MERSTLQDADVDGWAILNNPNKLRCMGWIHLAHDGVEWRNLLNIVISHPAPDNLSDYQLFQEG